MACTFLVRDKTLSSTIYVMTSQARGGGLDQQIPLAGRRGHRRSLLKGGGIERSPGSAARPSRQRRRPRARAVRSGEESAVRRRSCLTAWYQEQVRTKSRHLRIVRGRAMASSSRLLFLEAPTRCAMVAEPRRQQKSSVHRERRATKNTSSVPRRARPWEGRRAGRVPADRTGSSLHCR